MPRQYRTSPSSVPCTNRTGNAGAFDWKYAHICHRFRESGRTSERVWRSLKSRKSLTCVP
eukprot:932117-Rhodomonas_salina.1